MTDLEKTWIIQIAPYIDVLLEYIDSMVKAGYAKGYDDGMGRGYLAAHGDD